MKRTLLFSLAVALILSSAGLSAAASKPGSNGKDPSQSSVPDTKPKPKPGTQKPGTHNSSQPHTPGTAQIPSHRTRPANRTMGARPGQQTQVNPGMVLPLLQYRQKCADSFWGTCPDPKK